MKIGLFSFVIFLVTEFSAYVCTEVDENDFGQDFSTEFSEKLCASLNSMTKGWGLSAKLGKHSVIWGKLGTALQAYTLNPCTKFPPNPTSRKVNT